MMDAIWRLMVILLVGAAAGQALLAHAHLHGGDLWAHGAPTVSYLTQIILAGFIGIGVAVAMGVAALMKRP